MPAAKPAIAWFTNDLRLNDNAALTAAAAAGPVIPVYTLDEEIDGIRPMGGASQWWLEQSLRSLAETLSAKGLRLILRRGRAADVLASLVRETGAGSVHFSRGYAPWSPGREQAVRAAVEAAGATAHRYRGYVLFDPETIRTGADEPYKVYTPFSRACFAREPDRPPRPAPTEIAPFDGKVPSDELAAWRLYPGRPDWAKSFPETWQPGEAGARKKLDRFLAHALDGYRDDRNRPDLEATSRLSPHLHFGEISPLTIWFAVRNSMAAANGRSDRGGEHLLKELLWREFAYHLLHHWPNLATEPFRPEFSRFPWARNESGLKLWAKGLTGYPIVDAGMRELWQTGWMHNRVRMIVASFLVKDLLIPWQEGETWFWDTLVDADPANNAASWQWVAGCGADAAPYFRIFNPVLQGEKFDPEGAYVRRYVPELARLPAAVIHKPWLASPLVLKEAGVVLGESYPKPIVEHDRARDAALAAYERIKKSAA
ncbi:MAG: deoxyribodipyrimidine photo-lyase [Hyphomicrobiales bacterium]